LYSLTWTGASAPTRRIAIYRRRDSGPPSGALQAFVNCLSDLRPTLQDAGRRKPPD
jgi:hypothetical protein